MRTTLVGVTIVVLLMSGVATAGNITADFIRYKGDGNIANNIGNGGGGVFEFDFTGEAGDGVDWPATGYDPFIGFCIELREFLDSGNEVYKLMSPKLAPMLNGGLGAMGLSGERDLGILIENAWQGDAFGSWTPAQAAAFQLAVWEIVYEGANSGGTFTGSYDLDAGAFQSTDSYKAAAESLLDTWLNSLTTAQKEAADKATIGAIVRWDTATNLPANGQDYIVKLPDDFIIREIPLPPAVLMGLGLLGALGLARRIRRRK